MRWKDCAMSSWIIKASTFRENRERRLAPSLTAVFKLNGLFNILIRHGAYISVYCNLSSASVKQGDTVTTKQAIGQVFSDGADGGRTVLHFQLRREKEKLNPEPWLNR